MCRFNPRRKLELDTMQWHRVLNHVTVEVLALAQAGRDVSAVYTERAVKLEDWERTARVQVKVNKGTVELQLPTDDSLELIVKAVPASLVEEIIMAAENAEAVPKPVTTEGAQELAEELAEESAEEGVETATEAAAEESAEGLTKHYVDPRDIDAAEKTTMRDIKAAINSTMQRDGFVGKGKKRQPVILNEADQGFLQTPLADPTIKLAVSVLRPHNAETHADFHRFSNVCSN